ncbi:MAG: hypothetical protein DMG65_20120 [Candidatus Angelobacter sp. Gp1-AA117]|nr:MAG: hypothetical protein DMG65_20120 [Candidatus Angelobacter sp. Gp1-AA117]
MPARLEIEFICVGPELPLNIVELLLTMNVADEGDLSLGLSASLAYLDYAPPIQSILRNG